MFARIAYFYHHYLLGAPKITLIVLLALFSFFAYFSKDFKLDASADSLILESDKDLRIFRELNERYEGRDFLFVTFSPNEDLFSETSLKTIYQLREDLKQVKGVEAVTSLIDAPLLKMTGGTLAEVAENYTTLEDPAVDRDRARQELLSSPIFSNRLVSEDGQTTALLVYFKAQRKYAELQKRKNRLLIKRHVDGLSDVELVELDRVLQEYNAVKDRVDGDKRQSIAAIRALIDPYQDTGTLYLGGVSMIADDMITFIKHDLMVFGIGVVLFLVVMLLRIFRQARFVILPLLSCVFAVVIMMGVLGLSGWRVTVISSNFISLMLILTMSMNVHLIVRYRQLRRDFPQQTQKELVFNTTGRMVWPCLYTALTTMIGFGSLIISDIKPVIDFGWMMSMGLGVIFLTSFLLFPAVLMLFDKKVSAPERAEAPFTAALARTTERHGGKVVLLALLLAAGSVYGITRLKVENSFINYFSKSTEIYQGMKLIDEKLGGTTPLDIVLRFDSAAEYGEEEDGEGDEFSDLDDLFAGFETEPTDPADAWFTAYKVERIKAVHDYLDSLPAVGKVQSLASVLRLAEELNKGDAFDTFELAVINKKMPVAIKRALIDPYISIEHDEARVSVSILDSLPDLRREELLERIDRDLKQKLGLGADDFQISGMMVLYNNMLQSLFTSQIETLGVVMLGIALMLLLLFRSLTLAIIGVIPNILAAGIILGLMGIFGIPLDMMTITIAAITIGIAVDNSIHYIYRFREEYANRGDYVKTLYYCHANIGRAVFYTAITIVIGFSILMLSNFIPTIYFGLLTALAMLLALLAALTLLPKLILLLKPFKMA